MNRPAPSPPCLYYPAIVNFCKRLKNGSGCENKRLHAEQNAGIFGSPAILPRTDTDIPPPTYIYI
ncbi:hypothetical protein DI291_14390 [Bacillus paralicheniformis]|nr:hypothetical protein DI291_14390 [Bacillus paralicheniformis]